VLGVAAVLSLAYLFGAPRHTLTVELGEGVGLGFLGGVLLYVAGGLTREAETHSGIFSQGAAPAHGHRTSTTRSVRRQRHTRHHR
jgi:hypothetical protein